MLQINATLIGQFLTFIVLVMFTMKVIWPRIMKTLEERQARIADGLFAAERGVHELELAQHKAIEILKDAKIQSAEILEQANKRASRIIDEAKGRAREEGEKLIELAKVEITQEMIAAKQQLRTDITQIALLGTEKILQKNIDAQSNEYLLHQLIAEI